MVSREMLPLGYDHSLYTTAMEDLAGAAQSCPMTRSEQRCFVEFITSERTHSFLFKTRPIERAIGFSVAYTLEPGYLRLIEALRAGAPHVMMLIRKELESRQSRPAGWLS